MDWDFPWGGENWLFPPDLLFYLLGLIHFVYVELKPNCLFGQIQSSQTGDQPYIDTSPYKVGEHSLYGKLTLVLHGSNED